MSKCIEMEHQMHHNNRDDEKHSRGIEHRQHAR